MKQTELNSDFISLSFKGTTKVTNCVDYANNLIATGSEDNVIRIYESGLGEEQEDPVCEASHSQGSAWLDINDKNGPKSRVESQLSEF